MSQRMYLKRRKMYRRALTDEMSLLHGMAVKAEPDFLMVGNYVVKSVSRIRKCCPWSSGLGNNPARFVRISLT